MKKLAFLLVSLAFAADALAQTPAPDRAQGGPVQVAQAGGAAQGASLPPASGGTASGVAAMVAVGVAAIAAVTAYSSTSSASNH